MSALLGWPGLVVGLLVVLVALFALWCSWTAGRLDRMHLRLELAAASLDALLQQRAAVALELAVGGLGDPASQLLLLEAARAARDSRTLAEGERWLAESDLTAALLVVELPSASRQPLVAELVGISRQIGMARRIHNDLAATTRSLHRRRRVRWFRLAGHAAAPVMVDFDDRADLSTG